LRVGIFCAGYFTIQNSVTDGRHPFFDVDTPLVCRHDSNTDAVDKRRRPADSYTDKIVRRNNRTEDVNDAYHYSKL